YGILLFFPHDTSLTPDRLLFLNWEKKMNFARELILLFAILVFVSVHLEECFASPPDYTLKNVSQVHRINPVAIKLMSLAITLVTVVAI
ncbi:unnamed protein product, partial [Allacma fusca]